MSVGPAVPTGQPQWPGNTPGWPAPGPPSAPGWPGQPGPGAPGQSPSGASGQGGQETGSQVGIPLGATCYEHPERMASSVCRSCERPICTECMVEAPVGWQCRRCVRTNARRSPVTRYRPAPLRQPALRSAPVTMAIVVACVIVFAITQSSPGVVDQLVEWGFQISNGQLYRLFTAMFVHYNALHIGMDMLSLVIVGRVVEPAIGHWRFLGLYLVAGVAGNVACYALTAPNVGSAGASGAVFGLFGAYFVLARRASVSTSSIVTVIVLNLVIDFQIPGISWQAHVGGLIGGLVVTIGYVWARRQRRPVVFDVGVLVACSVVLGLVMLLPPGAVNLG